MGARREGEETELWLLCSLSTFLGLIIQKSGLLEQCMLNENRQLYSVTRVE